jgi:hypothetical protein
MRTGRGVLALAGGLVLTAGCGANGAAARAADEDSFAPRRVGSGIVIDGATTDGYDRSVLTILRRRVPGLQVTSTAICPLVAMRGRNSIHSPPGPAVFVDDSRATNTCVLDELRMDDVDRVEVYPTGVGPNPSYGANADGLILIYTRRAEL